MLGGYCALAGTGDGLTQDNVNVCCFTPAIRCLVLVLEVSLPGRWWRQPIPDGAAPRGDR